MIYLVFILSLSIDTFVAALAYEGSKIKIPFYSNLIISFICAFSIIISLLLGNISVNIINYNTVKLLSFFILFSLGIAKILNKPIKNYIKKQKLKHISKELSFIIEIYSDYIKADINKSKNLSKLEAIYLGFALSLDNLVSGLAFQTDYYLLPLLFLMSILTNIIMILLSRIVRNLNFNLSYLGGLIFIILAFTKL